MTHELTLTEAQVSCLIDVIKSDIEFSADDALASVNLQDVETCEYYLNRAVVLAMLKGLSK